MSVEAAVARVSQIEALLAQANGAAPVVPATQPASFQSQLQQASAAVPAAGPTAAGGGGPVDGQFSDLINAAAQKYGIDPALLKALIRQESNFNPSARSPAGASGLTQLMPGTAAALGVSNPLDPRQAIEGGAKYLSQQLKAFDGDVRKALAAYNAGPGAVQRYGGVPPYAETQNYVKKVQAFAAAYRGTPTATASVVPPTASTSLPYSTV
jgi:soluble lytic murein transglycosylase-like protein